MSKRIANPGLIAVVVSVGFMVALVIGVTLIARPNGIIQLPDWEHGVIICGEMFVVNEGHEGEGRLIEELKERARRQCPNGEKDIPPMQIIGE